MNREVAHSDIMDWYELYASDIHELVNRIYDDFESRTCSNCKHYKNLEVFDIGDYRDVCTHPVVDKFVSCPPKDFGCNKFVEQCIPSTSQEA